MMNYYKFIYCCISNANTYQGGTVGAGDLTVNGLLVTVAEVNNDSLFFIIVPQETKAYHGLSYLVVIDSSITKK